MRTPVPLLSFTVPGTPKSKDRPRTGKGGHTYTPRETQEAEEIVKLLFRSAASRVGHGVFPLPVDVEIRVDIVGYLPDARRRDWDNIAKLVCDALNKLAFADDSQIKQAWVELILDRQKPRTEITLYRLEKA